MKAWIGLGILALAVLVGTAGAQMMHGHNQGHMHGADGTGHDEVNMPGLRGVDATAEESDELRQMFQNFTALSRTVEHLPNGIRTRTLAADPELAGVLQSHVIGMIDRVDEGRDPQIMIQSPTLDIFFAKGGEIETTIDLIEGGIEVVQTSANPEIVAALHTHADEVTGMVERGMQAVHERMMGQARN